MTTLIFVQIVTVIIVKMIPQSDRGTEYDYTIKLIVIGDLRVGKTTLVNRYVTGTYNSRFRPSDGLGPQTMILDRNGKKILLRIWDTAGQERFRSLTASHYRDIQGCLLLFDVTQSQTFDNVQGWYDKLQRESDSTPKAILVGTKCHMYRTVPRERAEKLAEHLNIPYNEVSAELGLNVNEAFESLIQQIVTDLQQRSSARVVLTDLNDTKNEKWECGCSC